MLNEYNLRRRPASSAPNPSKTQEVLGQVEEVKGLMVNNIDIMLKNHERADSVLQKTGTHIKLYKNDNSYIIIIKRKNRS